MSSNYTRVCSQILYEFYGFAIQKVGDFLLKEGPQNLKSIINKTGLSGEKVREILRILIQHNLVTYSSKTGFSQALYRAQCRNIYFLLRLQRALALINQQLGLEARGIVEEIVCRGQVPLSKILFICGWKQLDENVNKANVPQKDVAGIVKKYHNTFEALAANHYCCRGLEIVPDPEVLVPELKSNTNSKYILPPVNFDVIAAKIIADNTDLSDCEDALIPWQIDIDNFYREWRDEVVIGALKKRYQKIVDNNIFRILASKTYSCSLDDGLPLESPWMSFGEIGQSLNRFAGGDKTVERLDEHLEIMLMDPKTVILVENPNVGPYCLNYTAAMTNILYDLVEHIILERHGFFSARIFRLVKEKKYVEQDRIAEAGMIPSKDAKRLTFVLMHDNFIKIRELRKTYTAASSNAQKTTSSFFYYIDINSVASALLESCYKSIQNTHIRSNFEKYNYRMILAKEERVARIHNTVRSRGATAEQLRDIEDLITPPEREVLRKASICNDKLVSAVFHIDDTIFILEEYFSCQKRKSLTETKK